MPTGMVVTVSDNWYKNVLEGISKGTTVIDYWTNGWLPDEKKRVNRIEVYYESSRILEGDFIRAYKDSPDDVFNAYQKDLYTIGLQPGDTIVQFDQMLNSAFRKDCGPKIGNIIFRVDGISSLIIERLRAEGINIPNQIKPLQPEKTDRKIRTIEYK